MAWSVPCRRLQNIHNSVEQYPAMKKIQVLFHDAGGGHRNAAVALQTVISQQNRGWQVELVQFQELTDHLDVLRKLTGIRIQEQYNTLLRNGWTLGATQLLRVLQATIRVFHRPLVKLLAGHFRNSDADLLVSVIPHFNQEIAEAWKLVHPDKAFVTLITDIADFPPHFWIESAENQYVICGSEKLAETFRGRKWNLPLHIVGFTKEVHRLMHAADFLVGKPGPGSVAEAMMRKLPVILECNAWTLPQERYNTEWVREKRVGIVLRNFRQIVGGVKQLLEPAMLAEFRRNVAALENRAIFEVPEIFAKLLGEESRPD